MSDIKTPKQAVKDFATSLTRSRIEALESIKRYMMFMLSSRINEGAWTDFERFGISSNQCNYVTTLGELTADEIYYIQKAFRSKCWEVSETRIACMVTNLREHPTHELTFKAFPKPRNGVFQRLIDWFTC